MGIVANFTFQFTHPGKGATGLETEVLKFRMVSIHAPWEGCDSCGGGDEARLSLVSIHAPWEGCDCSLLSNCYTKSVSIHAPWEGCDRYLAQPLTKR